MAATKGLSQESVWKSLSADFRCHIPHFDGKWTRSRVSLSQSKVRIDGLHTSDVIATQDSWSWIVDRGMKVYGYAKTRGLGAELHAAGTQMHRNKHERFARGSELECEVLGEVFKL